MRLCLLKENIIEIPLITTNIIWSGNCKVHILSFTVGKVDGLRFGLITVDQGWQHSQGHRYHRFYSHFQYLLLRVYSNASYYICMWWGCLYDYLRLCSSHLWSVPGPGSVTMAGEDVDTQEVASTSTTRDTSTLVASTITRYIHCNGFFCLTDGDIDR